jgi:hypothetical protein
MLDGVEEDVRWTAFGVNKGMCLAYSSDPKVLDEENQRGLLFDTREERRLEG